jgi:Phage integrase, N-terminal SAM-like domain
MSLHSTRSRRWEVRWREGVRNRSRTFDRKSDALQFEAEVRRIRQLGGIVPSRTGGLTLGEAAEQWFDEKRDLAAKTRFEYAKTLDRHVEPFLGHLPLTEIRPLLLNEWQQQRLAAGAGKEAIAKAGKLLRQILSRAVALELLASNAALTLQHPRTHARQPTIATPEQVEAIRSWFLDAVASAMRLSSPCSRTLGSGPWKGSRSTGLISMETACR